ncbi:hypothetical protein IOD13_14560 [Brevibacterium casei]|nr:hypothetical protein [Brevibacterium casei]
MRRSTQVRFGAAATVCLRETLVLGRSGEDGGAITSTTDVRDTTGAPYFVEELAIDGSSPEPGVMGTASVLDTAMLFGRRATRRHAATRTGTVESSTSRVLERSREQAGRTPTTRTSTPCGRRGRKRPRTVTTRPSPGAEFHR